MRFQKGMIPWNKGLHNEKTKEGGLKMARTRKQHGWFQDIDSFRKKRSFLTHGQNNPMSRSNRTRKELVARAIKVATTRYKNGSFKHDIEWCKRHGEMIKANFDRIGRIHEVKYNGFTMRIRNAIKVRDGRCCIVCRSSKRVAVHHVNYDKQDSREENLVTLCSSCHSKTNFKRSHWFEFFIRTYFGTPTVGKQIVSQNGVYYFI